MNRPTFSIGTALINPKVADNSPVNMTPAVETAFYAIAEELDRLRVPIPPTDSKELTVITLPTTRLKGEGARDDNKHLRKVLERLRIMSLEGETPKSIWGTGPISEYEIEKFGNKVILKLTPRAVAMFQSPRTFAKVEAHLMYSLDQNARRLYLVLADMKNLDRAEWTFTLSDLKEKMGLNAESYSRWDNFRRVVLKPSLEKINKAAPVTANVYPIREGKQIVAVKFVWEWKTLPDIAATAVEAERRPSERFKNQIDTDAPPLMQKTIAETALEKEFNQRLANKLIQFKENAKREPTKDERADEAERLREEMRLEREQFVRTVLHERRK
jgi:transcriptional regulator with XRE-family HTH domain